jgi:hypothetical protein
LTAFSIWCGVRGGSTEIVGTTSATAPCSASLATIPPACCLVRGTSTRQPNSGLVSNHDALSRSPAASPTTAMSGRSSPARASVAPTSDSGHDTDRWCTVVPRDVSTTGVRGDRPAASRPSADCRMSSSAPRTTTVVLAPACAVQSTSTPCGWMTCTPAVPAGVSGTPAYAGTAVAADTPGTTSKASPPLRQAAISSASPVNVAGSPSSRRTTRRPAFAADTTSFARPARVIGWPSSPKPASSTSTSGRQYAAIIR